MKGMPRPGSETGNLRNGTRAKAVLTEATGQVQIDVPRDRAGTLEPRIVQKRQRRLLLTGVPSGPEAQSSPHPFLTPARRSRHRGTHRTNDRGKCSKSATTARARAIEEGTAMFEFISWD